MARGKVPLDSAKVKAAAGRIARHGQKIPRPLPQRDRPRASPRPARVSGRTPKGFRNSADEMVADAAREHHRTIRECRSAKTGLSQARQDLQRLPQAIPGQEKEDGTPAIAAAIRLAGTGRSALGPRESAIDATATRPFIIFAGDLGPVRASYSGSPMRLQRPASWRGWPARAFARSRALALLMERLPFRNS